MNAPRAREALSKPSSRIDSRSTMIERHSTGPLTRTAADIVIAEATSEPGDKDEVKGLRQKLRMIKVWRHARA